MTFRNIKVMSKTNNKKKSVRVNFDDECNNKEEKGQSGEEVGRAGNRFPYLIPNNERLNTDEVEDGEGVTARNHFAMINKGN